MYALLFLIIGSLIGGLLTWVTFHVVAWVAGPKAAHDAALLSGPLWVLIFGGLGVFVGYGRDPNERLLQRQQFRKRLTDAIDWWVTHG